MSKEQELQQEVYELTAQVHELAAQADDLNKLVVELQEHHRSEAAGIYAEAQESVQARIDNMTNAAAEMKALYEAEVVKVRQEYEEQLITADIRNTALINRLAKYAD